MHDISLSALSGILFVLFLMSAFFSGSETALMALNRYRLKHLAESGHKGARRAYKLLQQPDRLIGLILLGNNFINILITQLATYIGYRVFGDTGIALATGVLTIFLLIFAELTPKTFGIIHTEKVAFSASFVLKPLLTLFLPFVWLINQIANNMLKFFGLSVKHEGAEALNYEELRTVVSEASSLIGGDHQKMLLQVLDLEKRTVEDIMIPRREIVGIDLEDEWDDILQQISQASYTRLPVFEGNIDNIKGFIHSRAIVRQVTNGLFDKETLVSLVRSPYFIPEGVNLTSQLLNFRAKKRRHALVVDEYGDILGMITMEDLLEEIVGEFTKDPAGFADDIHPQEDGSFIVDVGIHIRELNKATGCEFYTDGPRTLNGLILAHMEVIPETGTCMLINNYPVEIMRRSDDAVITAKIVPERVTTDIEQSGSS